MLYELHVKDMALISEARIELGEGLHVLTGETGAGKSLLLGSVNMALGAKTSPDMIRRGAQSALCELVFGVKNEDQQKALAALDVMPDDDGNLILSRKITPNRSSSMVNGEAFTVSKLREVASRLIDIHGQHEHQSLLKRSNHIRLLDDYAFGELADVLKKLSAAYESYKKAASELERASVSDMEREREISLINHEINEIKSAALKPGEDEELSERHRLVSNGRRIMDALSAVAALGSGQSRDGVSDALGRIIRELSGVAEFDGRLSDILSQMIQAEDIFGVALRDISGYIEDMDFDEAAADELEKRLDVINTLKQKYGRTIEEVLAYCDEQEERLKKLEDFEEYLKGLIKEKERAQGELDVLCEKVTAIRKKAAGQLEAEMKKELLELNFLSSDFAVKLTVSSDYSALGRDDVEFMISMNPGEPLKPLSQVTSGGELSRIMLSLRTVSALRDGIETLIFDEIDAGISGVTATKVAKKLSDLARGRQVICITHLPQIAAYGDRHYRIEKSAQDGVTTTTINAIDEDEQIEELIRLLGGTASADAAARELKKEAGDHKRGRA